MVSCCHTVFAGAVVTGCGASAWCARQGKWNPKIAAAAAHIAANRDMGTHTQQHSGQHSGQGTPACSCAHNPPHPCISAPPVAQQTIVLLQDQRTCSLQEQHTSPLQEQHTGLLQEQHTSLQKSSSSACRRLLLPAPAGTRSRWRTWGPSATAEERRPRLLPGKQRGQASRQRSRRRCSVSLWCRLCANLCTPKSSVPL